MIKVKNINKSFNGKRVLDNFSSQFEPGKINLIIGKSGSGKTIAVKCMLGLYDIDSGGVFYDKRNFVDIPQKDKKEIRKEIGMVFQGSALFDYMTIEDNIMFPLRMSSNMTMKEMKNRVDFCLKRVDLKNVNQLFPSQLSGGMQKRVAIARAISLNPKYLFCDEPNSGLDPSTAFVIDNLLKEITYEYNITTVINTHDMNSAVEIGDNIIFIQEGRKEWEGTSKNLFKSHNKFLNDFLFSSKIFRKLKGIV